MGMEEFVGWKWEGVWIDVGVEERKKREGKQILVSARAVRHMPIT
jgi:hypothetical protein